MGHLKRIAGLAVNLGLERISFRKTYPKGGGTRAVVDDGCSFENDVEAHLETESTAFTLWKWLKTQSGQNVVGESGYIPIVE